MAAITIADIGKRLKEPDTMKKMEAMKEQAIIELANIAGINCSRQDVATEKACKEILRRVEDAGYSIYENPSSGVLKTTYILEEFGEGVITTRETTVRFVIGAAGITIRP